jgi:hypothetical protein
MRWVKNKKDSDINQQYYVTHENKSVCKICIKGVFYYEMWIDKKFIKRANSFKEAINNGN